ncbi:DNA-binding protein D-ETS-3 [Eumeta japonica]|uniref:DNA-binding protein D-ETS-3 n=1 Tax=Eumeta variegata TaxID=151549 RepID=A0A4C2AEI6_EUMVA|nr:DNA-binding protein D-ETS-3 [Eumeta japonica]
MSNSFEGASTVARSGLHKRDFKYQSTSVVKSSNCRSDSAAPAALACAQSTMNRVGNVFRTYTAHITELRLSLKLHSRRLKCAAALRASADVAMYESSCSYAGALELKRSALKEEPWPSAEWPPYRLHQSTFEQLKQSVEKAKAALQDRSGLLGTATAFGDFYSGQLGQDANATLGFGRTTRADESMLGSIDKAKNLGELRTRHV